jgi:hypothetical protein
MFRKYKLAFLLCLLTILTQAVTAQTYCLKYDLTKSNNTTAEFAVRMAATGTTFNLGASNLQFKFNSKALSNPTLVSNTLAQTGVYNAITLTQPQPPGFDYANDGLISINFDFTGGTGTGLPIGLIGSDIAVLRFQIVDSSLTPNFRPYENGTAGTVVYNDNATNPVLLATTGNCAVYNTRIPILSVKANGSLKTDREVVTIDWTTTYEKPGTYFVIERSFSGRPFTAIGSYLFATYTFIDVNPLKGVNKYRVKQIDLNGAESTSREVEVSLEKAASINVYPSVVTELNGFVTLDVPRIEAIKRQDYYIYNALGREVLRGKTAERLDIDVTRLPVGTYLLKVDDEQMKFFKQ